MQADDFADLFGYLDADLDGFLDLFDIAPDFCGDRAASDIFKSQKLDRVGFEHRIRCREGGCVARTFQQAKGLFQAVRSAHRFFGVETPAFRRALKRRPFFVRRRIHRCVEGYDSVCKKCLVWCRFGF